jgi:ureidoglycolate lyase
VEIKVTPLTRGAFAPFGDVIEAEGSAAFTINDGFATRHHDLAEVDVLEAGGRPLLNIFHARPWPQPIRIRMLERHPLSSQAVVVAAPGDQPEPAQIHAFVTNGRQGVNYRRGVWHHPLLVLDREADFVVIDRGADGENCDIVHFDEQEHEAVLAIA